MSAVLDHIVINTRSGMDRAEGIFSGLGFTLTPRGHHTLGSRNHLMMFATDYLELVGIAEADAHKRPEIANGALGLDGLVFKTNDVDRTFVQLRDAGLAGDAPKEFSRPVALEDGQTQDARFRTVTARADALPGARLYFCQHLTPDLVWRPEWQSHANGATGFAELVVVTAQPARQAARLGELLDVHPEGNDQRGHALRFDDGFKLMFLNAEEYATRYGDIARSGEGRDGFLGAVSLRCDSLAAMRKFTRDQEAERVAEHDGRLDVAIDEFNTLLCFE